MIRLVIFGSRTAFPSFDDIEAGLHAMDLSTPDEVVTGRARGADACGEVWARRAGIPTVPFPADWERYGMLAGPIRNREMANYASHGLGFLDVDAAKSTGTRGMFALLERLSRPRLLVEWRRHR